MLLSHALRIKSQKSINDSYLVSSNNDNELAVTSYTFSSQSLGDPASNRSMILVVRCMRANTTTLPVINSVTVAGSSATEVVSATDTWTNLTLSRSGRVSIYALSLPSGTSGDVAFTFAANIEDISFVMFAVYNLNSLTAVGTATSSNTTSPSLNANVQADGFTLAGSITAINSGTNLTVSSNSRAAYDFPTATASPKTYALSVTGTTTGGTGEPIAACLASFK
jgi:hypothetical protein